MPKFIRLLYQILSSEQTERTRAIRDTGNFTLHPTFNQHKININHLTTITHEQRDKRTARFLNDKGKTNPNVIVSTDGSRTVQIPASAGKKKGQRKRPQGRQNVYAKFKEENNFGRIINCHTGNTRTVPQSGRGVLGLHRVCNTLTAVQT